MKKFLVIGNPIEHSLSPELHNYWIKRNNINAIYEKQKLNEDQLEQYISKVREDGKLDVRLDKTSRAKISDSAQVLMEILENKKYIPLTDKSDPDEIRAVVGMSKKTFKQAVGNLYKQRLITIEVSGIYLVE